MTTKIDLGTLSGTYAFDQVHSRFGFVARHLMVAKVRGQFNDFEGGLEVDEDNLLASNAWLTIQGKSIDTNNEQRDEHIRSNDFLALDQYPEVSFTTSSITGGGEHYEVTGELTIRGVTRSVTFGVTYLGSTIDPYGNTRVAFEGSTVVNRTDWGVNFNMALETGGVMIGEKVTLEFEIEAIKQ